MSNDDDILMFRDAPSAPIERKPSRPRVPRGYGTQVRALTVDAPPPPRSAALDRTLREQRSAVHDEAVSSVGHAVAEAEADPHEALRLQALLEAVDGAPKAPTSAVRSGYWSAVEHKALADDILATLNGQGGVGVDVGSILFQRQRGALGDPAKVRELIVAGGQPAFRDLLRAEREAMQELRFDPTRPVLRPRTSPGDALDYGEVVALAGDYYGTPEQLATQISHEVVKTIHGIKPAAAGEGYLVFHVGPAQFGLLGLDNIDHFAPWSWVRYCREHVRALELSLDRKLDEALFHNAFADHFLTDSFAAGHSRTPRYELSGRDSAGIMQVARAFLAGKSAMDMHDEDNLHGLWFECPAGYIFHGMGDKLLFNNRIQYVITAMALGRSVRRVIHAYSLDEGERATLRQAIHQARDYLPADNLVHTFIRRPADLPPVLGSLGDLDLPDVRELLPVPLATSPTPVQGTLVNYEPLFNDSGEKRSSTPSFDRFAQIYWGP